MPSFVCDFCQETLRKAKLDQHAQRCRQASFSCIDCYKIFKGVEYRAHTSCITEVQKHHTIKGKDGKQAGQPKLPAPKDLNNNHNFSVTQTPIKPVKETEKTSPKPKKAKIDEPTELDHILAILSKGKDLSFKELLKCIKKDKKIEKKQKKVTKKWIKEKLVFSIDASGNPIAKFSF